MGTRVSSARAALVLVVLSAAFAPDALAAGADDAARTFLFLAIALLVARLAGFVERFGQPAVLGELLAGVLLGNLGVGFLDGMRHDALVGFLAELGVVILLFQIGLESSFASLRRVGARALAVAVVGVALPFALGLGLGPVLMPGQSYNTYLFVGATLAATSVGITGRVFRDLGVLASREARIVLGAAVIDDVLGLLLLAVVSSLVAKGGVDAAALAWIVGQSVLFLVGAVVLGRLLSPRLARALAKVHAGEGMKFTLVLALGLGLAWLAHQIGLAAIVGAFAAGLFLEPAYFDDFEQPAIVQQIRPLLAGASAETSSALRKILDHHARQHHADLLGPLGYVFVPVFFVYTGMQVRLELFSSFALLLTALALAGVAVGGKLASGLAAGAARKWIVGWGMVPRGEVGLIFAAIGRELGAIDEPTFSAVVLMVILTTLVTPPVLARLLRREPLGGR
ncbi:MAG TPA: cation:proton antiporter [Burkholderiales bacterium]|nr:cation:proton antiporter [Burkholderiales bacterium]